MERFESRHGHTYFLYGGYGLLIEWKEHTEAQIVTAIRNLLSLLALESRKNLLDIIPGYDSILITYHPDKIKPLQLIEQIESLDIRDHLPGIEPKHHIIPVNYKAGQEWDLNDVATKANLTAQEVILRHTTPVYEVRFLGFLPGFPYMTGVDPTIQLPRKSTPRTQVPKGAVAIAMDQTGIYPTESPGGWHILGTTDYPLFDITSDPPSPLNAGDTVKYVAV